MCERGHGREPVSESVTEAKGEEMGREAFWPDARWATVMVDEGLRVGVNVTCDDHMEAFFITYIGLGQYKIIQKALNFLFGGKDAKLAQVEPPTPYAPTTRTVDPSDRSRLAAMALPDES